MKKFIHTLISLSKTIAIVCLWFLLTSFIIIGLSKLETEYYTPTDTPNPRFMVNGQRWQDFKTNPKPIITELYGDCMETCLKILDNGNYQYINEGALQTEYSEYQIKGDTVIPVSFEQQNFGHYLIAMVVAVFVIWLFYYLAKLYTHRKDKVYLISYHKKLAKDVLILVGVVGTIMAVGFLTAK